MNEDVICIEKKVLLFSVMSGVLNRYIYTNKIIINDDSIYPYLLNKIK